MVLKVGIVPYLNALPLTHDLDRCPSTQITSAVPTQLVKLLREDKLDIALVSSILYRDSDMLILPNLCIASHGPALSVKIICQKPIDQLKTINMDPSSQTSIVLARHLLKVSYGLSLEETFAPVHSPQATNTDAFLVIGDAALCLPHKGVSEIDLGDLWQDIYGVPFVYALWLVRPNVRLDPLEEYLQQSLHRFTQQIEAYALAKSLQFSLDYELCLRYWKKHLRYTLDSACLQGLYTFLNADQVEETKHLPGHWRWYQPTTGIGL